jgi:hypothetical protein
MFVNLEKEMVDTDNPKRVCPAAMELIESKVRGMRRENNSARLDPGQIAELREIVAGDLSIHKSICGYSKERIG